MSETLDKFFTINSFLHDEFYISYEVINEKLDKYEIFSYMANRGMEHITDINKDMMQKFDSFSDINETRVIYSLVLRDAFGETKQKMLENIQSNIIPLSKKIHYRLSEMVELDSNILCNKLCVELTKQTNQQWYSSPYDENYYIVENITSGKAFLVDKNNWLLTNPNDPKFPTLSHNKTGKLLYLDLTIPKENKKQVEMYTDLIMSTFAFKTPRSKRNEVKDRLTKPNPIFDQIPQLDKALAKVALSTEPMEHKLEKSLLAQSSHTTKTQTYPGPREYQKSRYVSDDGFSKY